MKKHLLIIMSSTVELPFLAAEFHLSTLELVYPVLGLSSMLPLSEIPIRSGDFLCNTTSVAYKPWKELCHFSHPHLHCLIR